MGYRKRFTVNDKNLSLEQRLSDEDKEYILNELERKRIKQAICDFYENYPIENLWSLVYLDVNLFYKLVEEQSGHSFALFSSGEKHIILRVLLQYNPELFERVVEKARRRVADLVDMRKLGDRDSVSDANWALLGMDDRLEGTVADVVNNKVGQWSVDDLFKDFESHLDPILSPPLRELAASDPFEFIDLLYQAVTTYTSNDARIAFRERLRQLFPFEKFEEFLESPFHRTEIYNTIPYLVKLIATQEKLSFKPNDATRFFEAYLGLPYIWRGRAKDDILQELHPLIAREKKVDYLTLERIVAFNEVSTLDELLDCSTIQSAYHVVCKLGQGKSGTTYKVYSPELKQYFALKIINDKFSPKEAELMARLKGQDLENIVQIHGAGTHIAKVNGEERYAILMEYVDGKTLQQMIDEAPKNFPIRQCQTLKVQYSGLIKYIDLNLFGLEDVGNNECVIYPKYPIIEFSDAIFYGAQILNGIISLRRHGITHRDLNLKNIKVTPKKELKILDFGIATDEEVPVQIDALRYGVPSSRTADDIFSLGLIVYELYTYSHLVFGKNQLMGSTTHRDVVAALKEQMYDGQGELKEEYEKKIKNYISPVVLACLNFESADIVKEAFVNTEPTTENYFLTKHDLIERISQLEEQLREYRAAELVDKMLERVKDDE